MLNKGIFDMKSNYFRPVIPIMLKKVLKNWMRGQLNAKIVCL